MTLVLLGIALCVRFLFPDFTRVLECTLILLAPAFLASPFFDLNFFGTGSAPPPLASTTDDGESWCSPAVSFRLLISAEAYAWVVEGPVQTAASQSNSVLRRFVCTGDVRGVCTVVCEFGTRVTIMYGPRSVSFSRHGAGSSPPA